MYKIEPIRIALTLFIMSLVCVSCGPSDRLTRTDPEELRTYFDAYDAVGTIVVRKDNTGEQLVYNPERAERAFLPASTFKIFNSSVALDTGVIGVDDVIKWDGVQRDFPGWNQDRNMRDAFKYSVVWFYQELARRVGAQRMQAALQRERYGNASIAGGIDQFWLHGGLRISALQQIDFLQRLHRRELGFQESTMRTVEEIMLIEKCADYTLRGKTGWKDQLGWLVGWVETDADTFYFAMNLESTDSDFPMVAARRAIVDGVLRHLNIMSAQCD